MMDSEHRIVPRDTTSLVQIGSHRQRKYRAIRLTPDKKARRLYSLRHHPILARRAKSAKVPSVQGLA